jgi:hypothetical protein
VLVNTSFNVRGEPIVGTPEDAFRCFMGTELEAPALSYWTDSGPRLVHTCVSPKLAGDLDRVDAGLLPSGGLIA